MNKRKYIWSIKALYEVLTLFNVKGIGYVIIINFLLNQARKVTFAGITAYSTANSLNSLLSLIHFETLYVNDDEQLSHQTLCAVL